MKGLRMLAVAGSCLFASPLLAQAAAGDDGAIVSVAVTGGTLGVGPEVGVRFSDMLGVRGSASFLGVNTDFDSDDVTYDGHLKLESYGAMLDVYPMGGHFRVSAGARINKNRARVDATPTSSVEIGNATYTPAQIGTLRGRADVKNIAPALTLGWSGARQRGFMFGFDAGVLFQGRVRVRNFTASGTAASNATFQANLESERRSLQDDVNDYKLYPIVQLAIGYRF